MPRGGNPNGTGEYFAVEAVRQALVKGRGVYAEAARLLPPMSDKPVSRRYVCEFVARHPELQETAKECKEIIVDTAELRYFEGIERGDPRFVNHCLSTLGKERGYTTRTEVTGQGGGAIRVRPELSGYTSDELRKLRAINKKAQQRSASGTNGSGGNRHRTRRTPSR